MNFTSLLLVVEMRLQGSVRKDMADAEWSSGTTTQNSQSEIGVRARYGPRNDARAAKSRVDDSGWKL